jgi:hypothetical protein
MAQGNTDVQRGYVAIVRAKDMTLWDYDQKVYDRSIDFDKNCWPVKRIAVHICCSPWIGVKIVWPILFFLSDKYSRSRMLRHDVPESQLLDVLSDYGILREVLPTEMGGTLLFDQAEWIASRRAAELGEI